MAYTRSDSHTSAPGLGFLGSTSYKADLIDGENDTDLRSISSSHGLPARDDDPAPRLHAPNRDSQVRKGARLIWLLQDMPVYEKYICKGFHPTHTCAQVLQWIMPCMQSIRDEISTPLESMRVAEKEAWLLQRSERIFQNNHGKNMRWETIGMLYTAVGLAAMAVTEEETDSSRGGWVCPYQKCELAKEMLEASDTCLGFCEEVGLLTDPELWVVFDNYILCSLVEGDASYLTWRRLGNVVSAGIAAGLHAEIKVSAECPLWMAEIRKQVAASIYCQDMGISSFLGRPPRLAKKYCAMQMPLDIELDDLRRPEPELAAIIATTTDQHGWNIEPTYRRALSTRCTMLCYMIREDILELTLATEPRDELTFAQDLVQRSANVFASLPRHVRHAALRPRVVSIGDFKMADILLQFKFNDFLLQRAVVKRFQWSNDELIHVSAEIIGCVLNMTEQIGAMGVSAVDVPWIIAECALPTAGVLSLELLRQSQGKTKTASTFNRSEVVQALSGLVSALKWAIGKKDGNYEICKQARHVLLRILDRVLDPAPMGDGINDRGGHGVTVGTYGIDNQDHDWLAGCQSEADFWSSLPNHPLLR